ncbi:MAG TPA: hypothetical protein VFO74_01980 [Pseudolabrys sp.]|nr:hypothetical protein [Pseudolabrys sp.]
MLTAESCEIDRLRSVQRECAAAALAAPTEREREYCMLGVNDYFVEEMILLYWKEAISNQLSAVSHKTQC